MISRAKMLLHRLEKRAQKGDRGDPVCTVAFYGPNDRVASKVVATILENQELLAIEKWYSETGDVRKDEEIMRAVIAFLERSGARSVALTPGIFGCPHEEVIDYPEGEACPACPFWATHDRMAILDDPKSE